MQSWQMHVVDYTLREFENSCSDRGTSTLQVKDNATINTIDVISWRGLTATRCNTLQHAGITAGMMMIAFIITLGENNVVLALGTLTSFLTYLQWVASFALFVSRTVVGMKALAKHFHPYYSILVTRVHLYSAFIPTTVRTCNLGFLRMFPGVYISRV